MLDEAKQTRLLEFFQVMGNERRLRLAVYLMDKPCTVQELARQFDMKELAVRETLAALRFLNLVTEHKGVSDGEAQARYGFDIKALYALNKEMLSRENLPTPIDDLNEEERRMLRPFFNGERLMEIPLNPKKFRVLVHWLATHFEEGVRYSEKQVNEIITRYHEDYATLRRALIEEHLMERDHGIYWRISPNPNA
jgi:hypothetical protein